MHSLPLDLAACFVFGLDSRCQMQHMYKDLLEAKLDSVGGEVLSTQCSAMQTSPMYIILIDC